jgi:nucleotide-binding universal stress UspA family protein
MRIARILVPTDFSSPSREATDYALGLARAFGAKVSLLHVIEDPIIAIPALVCYAPDAAALEAFSETALANWVLPEDSQGVSVEHHWVHGHPVARILDFVRRHDCDLIVMGTHGRSPVTHALIGSVAEKVVRKAACPVLTVRPKTAGESVFEPSVAGVEG